MKNNISTTPKEGASDETEETLSRAFPRRAFLKGALATAPLLFIDPAQLWAKKQWSAGEEDDTGPSTTTERYLIPSIDGAWIRAKTVRNDFYFVTTAGINTNSRLWRLRFDNIEQPENAGTIEILLKGDEGHRMLDNVTIDGHGHILMDERSRQYTPKRQDLDVRSRQRRSYSARRAQPGVFDASIPNNSNFLTQDEESTRGKRSLTAQLQAARLDLHEILNQLSVISLGCFTLRNLLEGKLGNFREFETIEAAVSRGAERLEKLSQSIQAIEESSTRGKTGPGAASFLRCRQCVSYFTSPRAAPMKAPRT